MTMQFVHNVQPGPREFVTQHGGQPTRQKVSHTTFPRKSESFTGLPSAVCQLRRFQPAIHSLIPFCTYCESVWTSGK